jgi:hypothetical protein
MQTDLIFHLAGASGRGQKKAPLGHMPEGL